ncbi:DUF2188 domain-containing protein (plasmid) [Cupriavidus sp. P-10]|uniref:DUF2188 domain-containing protein n=1 Tax=Cupriavidus sp. P-10 TaxID=2027911 RepID=UPI000E2FD803|nr:DUF2188 domain-containing protein [Cupriavidus sp. P-10]BDB29051.1 DUF2188 domain-containing protein [Cupriavidus sp. P-10]
MNVATVQVIPADEGQWKVEGDESEDRTTYSTRAEAIAAGVHMALENEAVLLILSRTRERRELDFKDCGIASQH